MLKGTEVTIEDMMMCRERRAFTQQEFINTYHCPVISFCLNIPGPIKTNKEIRQLFEEGKKEIFTILEKNDILINEQREFHEISGDEILISVEQNADFIKNQMLTIEENHPLGRLFDIDIINIEGQKISRNFYRKCLICDCQAQECARSRKHSVKEMQDKIEALLTKYTFQEDTLP